MNIVCRELLQFAGWESISNCLHEDDQALYAEHLKNLNDLVSLI